MRKKFILNLLISFLNFAYPVNFLSAQTGTVMKFKIFGPAYENVTITGQELKGAVYFLESGHGGPDPGAIGKYLHHNLCEDEYAYDVILRLGRKLIENGATVFFIIRDSDDGIRDGKFLVCDKDETCYPSLAIPSDQLKRLRQRTNAVNELSSRYRSSFQRFISIHVDARNRDKNIDVFFYHDKKSRKGEKAATILKDTFMQKYNRHQPGRGYKGTVSDRNLYVVANSVPVAVYIELGNIHHSRDQQRIVDSNNRQALANWLAEGLMKDYRTNK